MNNNPNHILFFSKHCIHCKDFFSKLIKSDYNNKFIKIGESYVENIFEEL